MTFIEANDPVYKNVKPVWTTQVVYFNKLINIINYNIITDP